MNDVKWAIVEGLLLMFLVALVLPALISAKSTTLVMLGISIIIGVMCVAFGVTPYKSRIVEMIKKDVL